MSDVPAPKAVFLLAGGPGRRPGRDPVLVRAIESAGANHPSIAYVGAASGDNRSFFAMIAAYLKLCGAGNVALAAMAGRRADLGKTRALLEESDMILVSGGDVEAGMEIVEERGMLQPLRDLYRAGKPYLGISAGSIMIARQWIRWEDEDDDSSARLFPCLGIADVLCDTHGEGDEWEELRALIALCPDGTAGYGIPTGAGLVVAPDGSLEALGRAADVFVSRGRAAMPAPPVTPGRPLPGTTR